MEIMFSGIFHCGGQDDLHGVIRGVSSGCYNGAVFSPHFDGLEGAISPQLLGNREGDEISCTAAFTEG